MILNWKDIMGFGIPRNGFGIGMYILINQILCIIV